MRTTFKYRGNHVFFEQMYRKKAPNFNKETKRFCELREVDGALYFLRDYFVAKRRHVSTTVSGFKEMDSIPSSINH